jgi:FeS assembly protein IscX
MALMWTDVEDIALLLQENYPDVDPLDLRFTELHRMITALPGFNDDPKKSTETILEAIQMGWHEENQEQRGAGPRGASGV